MKSLSKLKFSLRYLFFTSFCFSTVADEKVDKFIQQLGASTYSQREAASKELWSIGQPTLRALKKASQSSDPEIKSRALKLLAKIEIGLTPDTPKEFIRPLKDFLTSDLKTQTEILQKVSQLKGGWQVVRSLLFKSTNQKLANSLLKKDIKGETIILLRESRKVKEAQALLEIAAVFSDKDIWKRNLADFLLEGENAPALIINLFEFNKNLGEDKLNLKINTLHCVALIQRIHGQYPEAAKTSRQVFELVKRHNNASQKDAVHRLLLDTHLLTKEYLYLEKYWQTNTLKKSTESQLTNLLYLQRLQNKTQAYINTNKQLVELLDKKKSFHKLSITLLLNGEIEQAFKIYAKYDASQTIAKIERSRFNIDEYVSWQKKNIKKSENTRLNYLSFMAQSTKDKKYAEEIVSNLKVQQELTKKITSALYLKDSGFNKLAAKELKALLLEQDLKNSQPETLAYAYFDNRTLAKLYAITRQKSNHKNLTKTLEVIELLNLSDDEDAFRSYLKLIETNVVDFEQRLPIYVYYLSQYCMDKKWYKKVSDLMRLLSARQKSTLFLLLESDALIQDKRPAAAALNILGLHKVPKKAAPFYFVAHAYKLANETEKSQKALKLAKI